MRTRRIASSEEYWIDKQFQNLLIFGISIIFQIEKILNLLIFQFRKFLKFLI